MEQCAFAQCTYNFGISFLRFSPIHGLTFGCNAGDSNAERQGEICDYIWIELPAIKLKYYVALGR
jgi:hypothetical protein